MANEPVIRDVSDTALWVAVYRAKESERPDALFRDPFAKMLAGEKGPQIASHVTGSRYTEWQVITRTYVIDNFIRELVSRDVDTVINLGAGLDTRPYRMDLPPSLRWIEVDFDHMMALKNERLRSEKPKCRLERLALDLSNRQLRQSFFARVGAETKKALILTEGVIPYLTPQQTAELAEDLLQQKSFRYWIVEYIAADVQRYLKARRSNSKMGNAPFKFFVDQWFEFFADHGWRAAETRYLGEESVRLGRPVPFPLIGRIFGFFAGAERRKTFLKMMGYILLEPKS